MINLNPISLENTIQMEFINPFSNSSVTYHFFNSEKFDQAILSDGQFWKNLTLIEKSIYHLLFFYEREIRNNLINVSDLISDKILSILLNDYTTIEEKYNELFISIKTHKDHFLTIILGTIYLEQNYDFSLYHTADLCLSTETTSSKEWQSKLMPHRDLTYDISALKKILFQYIQPHETIQGAFLNTSITFSKSKFQQSNEKILEYYHAISNKKISLSTPILSNFRFYSTNPRLNSVASCFIFNAADTMKGISEIFTSVVDVASNLGGTSIYMGRVRSNLIKTRLGNQAAGVVSLSKIFDTLSMCYAQTKPRKSAVTIALPVFHIQLLEFLDSKKETGGAMTNKCYEIFHQVALYDEFLQRVKNNEDWYMFDPKQIRTTYSIDLNDVFGEEFSYWYNKIVNDIPNSNIFYSKMNARQIMIEILHTMIETGVPFLFFACTANRLNPNPEVGVINCANLCVESFSASQPIGKRDKEGMSHVCNLISINLSNMENMEEIKYYSGIATEILNSICDMSHHALSHVDRHDKNMRVLGVGAMGYADYLAWNDIKYSESKQVAQDIAEEMALSCLNTSSDNASVLGSYTYFDQSEWKKGNFFGEKIENMSERWKQLYQKILKQGLSNGQVMAFAPTASTSLMLSAQPSLFPCFAKFILDNNQVSSSLINIPRYSMTKTYCTLQDIDMKSFFNVVSGFQKYTDSGISAELYYNVSEMTPVNVLKDILFIWKNNIKTIYYTRLKKTEAITSQETSLCEQCSL